MLFTAKALVTADQVQALTNIMNQVPTHKLELDLDIDNIHDKLNDIRSSGVPILHNEHLIQLSGHHHLAQAKVTSSGNILVLGFEEPKDEDGENYLTVGYSGTRGRFMEEVQELNYHGVDLVQILGIPDDSWEIYRTTGPRDMAPWENQITFFDRLIEENDERTVMMLRNAVKNKLAYEATLSDGHIISRRSDVTTSEHVQIIDNMLNAFSAFNGEW